MQWWALQSQIMHLDYRLLFAIPNGGNRDAVTGAILKAEGVRAGVPDLCLAVPSGQFHGLFIEMKTQRGRASSSQKEMLSILSAQGYDVSICHGFDDARDKILHYLTGVS